MQPKALIVAGWLVNAIAAALAAIFPRDTPRVAAELGVIAALSVLYWTQWPVEIVCGPDEIETFGLLGRRTCLIRWDEVGAIEEGHEVRGLGARWGLRSDVLRIVSEDGRRVIVHTPRHPDRDRFRRECGLRIEERQHKRPATGSGSGASVS